jgi:hemoglobin
VNQTGAQTANSVQEAVRDRLLRRETASVAPTIFEAAGGEQAFLDLAHAWHERVIADPVVSHAFSHGYHPQHTERLAAYWAEALGGPPRFTQSIGDETSVVRMHAGNGEHHEMDERAQTCFAQALDDAQLPDDPRLRSTLKDYFRWATERMAEYPNSPDDVPIGLPLTHWNWDGPEQVNRGASNRAP